MTLLYTTKTCSKCPTAKNFLKQRGIDFEERDIDNYYEEVVRLGVSEFPIIVMDGEVVAGFNLSKLMPLLKS